MRYGPGAFFKDQWTKQKPVIHAELTGKTVVVIGANAGIGFEATKHFASMNPGRLILACRNQTKGQIAVDSTWYYIDTSPFSSERVRIEGRNWILDSGAMDH